MAYRQLDGRPPLSCASQAAQNIPVSFLQGGSALSETVIPVATWNIPAFALTAATVASAGDPVELAYPKEVGKGIAGASLGAGAFVGVGSTNGVLAPLSATGGPASANLVTVRYAVGIAMSNAAAGDTFSVLVLPQQIV